MNVTFAGATLMLGALKSSGPLYLGLYTAIPDKTGGGQEVVSPSYARQLIEFGPVAGGSMSNGNLLQYAQATTDWGKVTGWAISSAQTGGTVLWSGNFIDPATINRGSYFFVDPNGITLTVD